MRDALIRSIVLVSAVSCWTGCAKVSRSGSGVCERTCLPVYQFSPGYSGTYAEQLRKTPLVDLEHVTWTELPEPGAIKYRLLPRRPLHDALMWRQNTPAARCSWWPTTTAPV